MDDYANRWLDCAMCGAAEAFMINSNDPALGYCRVEDKHWRIEPGPLSGPTAYSHLPGYYDLLEAAKAAKKYLESELDEPGRTVFWQLVAAIKKAETTRGEKGDRFQVNASEERSDECKDQSRA